jgi:integrase
VLFRDYAADYLAWAEKRHRSWTTTRSQVRHLLPVFGPKVLDEISTDDVERFLTSLLGRVSRATVNRYRDRLSGMFRRASRLGLLSSNPVTPVEKFKEPGGRDVYLTAEEERAVTEALPEKYRPDFTISIHTGLRWTEQMGLRWEDVDLLTSFISVRQSKHGDSRRVPINAAARSAFLDLAARRQRPTTEPKPSYPTARSRPTSSSRGMCSGQQRPCGRLVGTAAV